MREIEADAARPVGGHLGRELGRNLGRELGRELGRDLGRNLGRGVHVHGVQEALVRLAWLG